MKAYIARDKDNGLFIYDEKPYKMWSEWWREDSCYPIRDSVLPEGINPQWEDDEPLEVELTIKKI